MWDCTDTASKVGTIVERVREGPIVDVLVEKDGRRHSIPIDDALEPLYATMCTRGLVIRAASRLNVLRLAVHDPGCGDIAERAVRRPPREDCRRAVVEALEDLVRRAGLYAQAPTEMECNAVGDGLSAPAVGGPP